MTRLAPQHEPRHSPRLWHSLRLQNLPTVAEIVASLFCLRRIARTLSPATLLLTLILLGTPAPSGSAAHRVEAADEPSIVFRHEPHDESEAKEPMRAYSPSRKVVIRSTGERFKARVRLYDADTDKPIGPEIDLRAHRITALAVSPDDRSIATAIGNLSNDWGEVRVWNGQTGKQLAQYKLAPEKKLPPLGEVFRLTFSEDGMTLTITSAPAGGK